MSSLEHLVSHQVSGAVVWGWFHLVGAGASGPKSFAHHSLPSLGDDHDLRKVIPSSIITLP